MNASFLYRPRRKHFRQVETSDLQMKGDIYAEFICFANT